MNPAVDQVLDALADAVVITNPQLVVTVWNRAAEQLFGFDRREAFGRSALTVGICSDDQQLATEVFGQVLAGRAWEGSLPVRTKGGRPLIGRFRLTPSIDATGRVTSVVLAGRDTLAASEDQHRALGRLALLSHAGELLGASLETDRTLATMAELLVPGMADHCFVDLIDAGGRVTRLVNVHIEGVDPNATGWTPVGQRPGHCEREWFAHLLRTGRGLLKTDLQTQQLEGMTSNPQSAAWTRAVGVRSAMYVPLGGSRRTMGVLGVMTSVSGRRYDQDDLDLLEGIAARAGLALDNADLFGQQRTVSLALQRSLLPAELPRVDGIEVAYRYSPGQESEVGGDFYDVIPLPTGRVGIVIGDVQGRGPHAAAVMGQLRAALRAYAVLDLDPAQVVTYLDDLVQDLNESMMVTCVYGVYDPYTRRCVLANAGNPPPLLLPAGEGEARLLGPADPPLGMGAMAYDQQECEIPAGTTLLLYTDGVVERRDLPVDQGVQRLRAALTGAGVAAGGDLAGLCERTLGAVAGGAVDDQAVLAVRTDLAVLPVSRLVLPAQPVAAASARHHASQVLAEWGLSEHIEVVELLVSELITNSVRHADAPGGLAERREAPGWVDLSPQRRRRQLELVLRRGSQALWCEVHDSDMRLPRVRQAQETDEDGRGLYLVEAMSTRWGARSTRRGKTVWFEVAI